MCKKVVRLFIDVFVFLRFFERLVEVLNNIFCFGWVFFAIKIHLPVLFFSPLLSVTVLRGSFHAV